MPLTTKRDLYVQLMNQGFDNSAACRQVGVNRKTGQRWRLGRVVKDPKHGEYHYEPIGAPGPNAPGSDRYLSDQERIVIADGVRAGRSKRAIANTAEDRFAPCGPPRRRYGSEGWGFDSLRAH